MSDVSADASTSEAHLPHPYFVDETGDGVIFDGKGRVLVGIRKAAGTFPDAAIHVRAMPSQQHAGLQLADYCLWALQRVFTKGEDRFLSLIWTKVGLIVDADDISEKPYGTYHTRKRPPLDALKMKSRKVED
jgi:hypothetical protein